MLFGDASRSGVKPRRSLSRAAWPAITEGRGAIAPHPATQSDERTLADWLDKAEEHLKRVQEYLVYQGEQSLGQG
jgi:hypothetical protein